MVYHAVIVPKQLKSVALSTLFPSLPNKRHSSDISQSITLLTFVNCHTSDEMWSDVLDVTLPTFVNGHNSDEIWSDVLNVACSTFLYCRSSEVFNLSQFRHLQGVGIVTAGSI